MEEIPLGTQTNYSRPRGFQQTDHNDNPFLDTTYSRYEQAPFRQYSRRVQDQAPLLTPGFARPRQKLSKESLLRRMLSRQSRLENTVNQAVGNTHGFAHSRSTASRNKSTKTQRPKPNYSLAGPRPNEHVEHEEEITADGFERYGERPKPNWGLAKPFPHMKRRKGKNLSGRGRAPNRGGTRKSAGGHPYGQVGGGPGGHHGSPVRGQPEGEVPGGPASNARNPEDEDEGGHTNYLEHFANWDNEDGDLHNSQETLTKDDQDEEERDNETPNFWFGIRRKIREPLAEWLGTLVAVLVGTAGNLQVKTSQGSAGSFTQEAAMWGLGTMMAVYIAGGVSGAHCNPMVSIFLSVFRGFPARKAVIYIVAQCIGATCAVLIAFGIYKDAILHYDPGLTSTTTGTGTSFFTLPQPFTTPITAFFTDFTSAAVMSGTILALGDDTNAPPGAGMHAFILALIGFAMASSLGYNTGPQTNPAKDLASRLVPFWVGYGDSVWKQGWWAEAWTAAIFGGLFGCLIYDLAIFEGEESPVNWPAHKRRKSRRGTKGRWLSTGWFGRGRRDRARKDLEDGKIGIREKGAGHRLSGHGES